MVKLKQLYNLETDLGEKVDVVKQHPEILKQLVEKNNEWISTMEKEVRPHAEMTDPSGLVSELEGYEMTKLSEWFSKKKSR